MKSPMKIINSVGASLATGSTACAFAEMTGTDVGSGCSTELVPDAISAVSASTIVSALALAPVAVETTENCSGETLGQR